MIPDEFVTRIMAETYLHKYEYQKKKNEIHLTESKKKL